MTIRITKSMAEKAAKKMTSKAYDEKIKKITEEINVEVEKIARKYIPSPIIACVKEYQSYFYTRNSIGVTSFNEKGYRENYIHGNLTFDIPTSICTINIELREYRELKKLDDKRADINHESHKFNERITEALVSLGTLKRVQEKLPEAVKYIELPSSAMALAPVYDDLNEIIRAIK